jgi:hypothetical protein
MNFPVFHTSLPPTLSSPNAALRVTEFVGYHLKVSTSLQRRGTGGSLHRESGGPPCRGGAEGIQRVT